MRLGSNSANHRHKIVRGFLLLLPSLLTAPLGNEIPIEYYYHFVCSVVVAAILVGNNTLKAMFTLNKLETIFPFMSSLI